MTARIDKLEIVGFRGATKPLEIHFDTSKPVTMIFGENGTGKSTVADAFDFACNGKYGSLEDRSFSGQNKTHVVSAGQPASAVSVRLVSGAKTWTTTLADASASKAPELILVKINNTITAIHDSQGRLNEQLVLVLDLQSRVGKEIMRCEQALTKIADMQQSTVSGILVQDSLSVWNIELWTAEKQ